MPGALLGSFPESKVPRFPKLSDGDHTAPIAFLDEREAQMSQEDSFLREFCLSLPMERTRGGLAWHSHAMAHSGESWDVQGS